MDNFTVQRSDIRRAFSKARVFAVNAKIVSGSEESVARAVEKLSGSGVQTVFFNSAESIDASGAVFLAFTESDASAEARAVFFAAPASAPLEVKMRCAYVSNSDGEDAFVEMADLIMQAKRS